jgi:hypothetical protein
MENGMKSPMKSAMNSSLVLLLLFIKQEKICEKECNELSLVP